MSLVEVGARYVLTNSALGSSLALASTNSNASLVVEPLNSSAESQIWFVTAAADDKDRFHLHTIQKGENWAVGVASYVTLSTLELHFFSKGAYNGQLWRFDKWGDGVDIRLSNKYFGVDIRLDVGTSRQVRLTGGDYPGQHWTMSKLGSVATATSGSATASATATATAAITAATTVASVATSSATATASGQPNSGKSGINWNVVGPAIGGSLGALVIIGLGVILIRRYKKRKEAKKSFLPTMR